jgi:4-carboxymuconolactone decarboxylase
MPATVKPPKAYDEFIAQFPKLDEAWSAINEAGAVGPLDERGRRLVKLGIAMGAMREGAIRSGVRKAVAMGIEPEAIVQVVALCAGTLGMPSTVAVHTWVKAELDKTRS